MTAYNLRILAERLLELEARVAKLEDGRTVSAGEFGQQYSDKFTLEQRGRWWYCVSPEGTRLNETGLSKEDAQKLADDMNGATKEMVDA